MKILIAEDDLVSQQVIQSYLAPYGKCDIVDDGAQAFEAFLTAWEDKQPYDLVCLDIMMPERDGHQALQEIRQWEKERDIYQDDGVKVIMVTALGDVDNINQAFRERCVAYLVKPVIRDSLRKVLRELRLLHDE